MYPDILLIDDDDDDQFIFLTALENVAPGSHCDISNNALEAFEYLHSGTAPPDMIFLDLNMPLMNGFEFLIVLKNDPRFALIPVIIYSTSDSPEDQARAKELGGLQFITKTSDIELLKKDLRHIVDKTGVMESLIH